MVRKRKRWTAKEDEFLIEHYGKMLHRDIARELNRPLGSIPSRAQMLGILRKHSDAEAAELSVKQVVKGGLLDIG